MLMNYRNYLLLYKQKLIRNEYLFLSTLSNNNNPKTNKNTNVTTNASSNDNSSSTSSSSSSYNRRSSSNRNYRLFIKGLPFIIFIVGGSYFLSVFMSTHMEIKDKNNNSKSTRKFDLEEEHRMLLQKLHIDDFKLSRIPRPTDNDNVSNTVTSDAVLSNKTSNKSTTITNKN